MINPRKKKILLSRTEGHKKEVKFISYLKIPIVQTIEWLKESSWRGNVKAGEAFCPKVRKQHFKKRDSFSVFCLHDTG